MMISRKMNAKCCHLSATRKASLYLLAVLSAMGLLSTLYIAATAAAAASSSSGGDAPSFDAPSSSLPPAEEGAARRRDLSEDATSTTMGNSTIIEDGEAARRRREAFLAATAKDDAPLPPSPTDDAGRNNRTGLLRGRGQPRAVEEKPPERQRPREHPPDKDKDKNADKRPSGVVYEFIPPPPINATARALLRTQFPNLADLDQPAPSSSSSSSASSSTALCGIVKDAEAYLDEWVDYHFGLGFHTIYLVDNSRDHELRNWQDRRRNSGYAVRVIPKPGTHRQMYSYHMCAAEFKDYHAHMAFFDVDEYLVLKKHDTVDDFLRDHLPGGALQISWYIFGTNSRDMYSPLPVTRRFTLRDGDTEIDRHPSEWHNVKTILKLSDYGGYPKSPHSMNTNKDTAGSDKAWIDTNGKGNFDSIGSINYDRPVDVAVIHHYKYLSSKEFRWKSCVRKTVDDKYKDCGDISTQELSSAPFAGSVYDDSAWRLLKKNVPKYAAFDEFEDFM